MSKIQTADVSTILMEISGLGEFLFQGMLKESELLEAEGGLEKFLDEYPEMNISSTAKTITENWSENKPYYKDSGSSTLTGINLGNAETALLRTLKDKGSSTEIKPYGKEFKNTWDLSVDFGKGFNPFSSNKVKITSYSYSNVKKGNGGTESGTTSFKGEVTLERAEDGSFVILPEWVLYSFNDVWSDNYPGETESGSLSIQSKEGLFFNGESLSGNVDSISYTYKDNSGVTHTFNSGPLNQDQLDGLQYILAHPRDEKDSKPMSEDFENAVKKFVLGGDDEITASVNGDIRLEGGLGNDTYIIKKASDLANIFENANEGVDTVKIAFAGAKNQVLAEAAQNNGEFPYFLQVPPNIEQLVITGSGFFKVEFNGFEFVMTTGDTLALVGDEPVLLAKGQTLMTVADGDSQVDALASSASISLSEDSIIQAALLQGSAATNITGNSSDNILIGNAGKNVLNGGAGADRMEGGKGNDTYYVDDEGDRVIENVNAGTDTVIASVSYELSDNVENLTLTGNEDLDGTGNELNNTIKGNDGNNRLDGGAGIDRLEGGKGDDTYVVDLVAKGVVTKTGSYANATVAIEDTIVEASNAGVDTVELRIDDVLLGRMAESSKTTTLTLANNLENLDASQTGELKLNLTGNAANNLLTGNDADNVLNGGAGNDVLLGGAGNDTLIGGVGADIMTGGEGNDVFKITSLNDLGLGEGLQDVITDFTVNEDVIDLSALKSGNNVWRFNGDNSTEEARSVWVKYTEATDTDDAFATVFFEANNKEGADYSIKLVGVTEEISDNSFVFA